MKLTENKQINPLTNYVFVKKKENPYIKTKSDTGIILTTKTTVHTESTGSYGTEEQGEMVLFGEVVAAGPKCETLIEGDEVYFYKHSMRPLPFGDLETVLVNELNIMTYIR